MDPSLYQPIATCDIPRPIVEPRASADPAVLPRILVQAAGMKAASRRLVLLSALFLALSLFEAVLLFRLRVPDPLIFYHDLPRKILLEAPK
jgi:hypothetical protein